MQFYGRFLSVGFAWLCMHVQCLYSSIDYNVQYVYITFTFSSCDFSEVSLRKCRGTLAVQWLYKTSHKC